MVEEKFKGLEKARKDAMEVEKEENQKAQETEKSQQNVILQKFFIPYDDVLPWTTNWRNILRIL
nr:hypothetical protein [Thermoplasma sp.]